MEREKYSLWERIFKETLRKNRTELVEKMQVDYGLYTHLRSDEVITERIKSGRESRSQQVEHLLDLISKKSWSQQYYFIQCLRLSNQDHLADLIKPDDSIYKLGTFEILHRVDMIKMKKDMDLALQETYREKYRDKTDFITEDAQETIAESLLKFNILEDVADPRYMYNGTKRGLVPSEAGNYGDTKFSQNAAAKWCNKGPHDKSLFVISLSEIRPRTKSLPEIILDQFPRICNGKTYENTLKELEYMLDNMCSSFALILDGLQDYDYQSFEINDIINGNKYADITTIVTRHPDTRRL